MKKFLCFLTALLLVSVVNATPQVLIDEEQLLTVQEVAKLEDMLLEIRERRQADVVIVTVGSLGGKSARSYAESFYNRGAYSEDGILLLISMQEREFWIATFGSCIGLENHITDSFVDFLSAGEYYEAFVDFAEQCDEVAEDAPGEESSNPATPILICLGIGLVVGLITTGIMAAQLKSVRSKPAAGDYVVPGSLNLTRSYDLFLYRNVRRTPKPKSSSSSSGRSSGGRGGRF